jgi:hypothetical protein
MDFMHSSELSTAIYPTRYGDWIIVGRTIVKAKNTADFKTGNEDAIVTTFRCTRHGEFIG